MTANLSWEEAGEMDLFQALVLTKRRYQLNQVKIIRIKGVINFLWVFVAVGQMETHQLRSNLFQTTSSILTSLMMITGKILTIDFTLGFILWIQPNSKCSSSPWG
jgi:hypothetical protein